MEQKYFVVKREDWQQLVGSCTQRLEKPTLDEVEGTFINGEFFVVRDQDVFAPAGLYAYAANIHSAVEFQDTLGPSVMSEEVRERLMILADELASMADKWKANRTHKKVPD